MDCSLPGSSIHGVFQARVLESVAIAFSQTTHYSPVLQSPCDWSPDQAIPFAVVVFSHSVMSDSFVTPRTASGASVQGISQARILEWLAISFSVPFIITLIFSLKTVSPSLSKNCYSSLTCLNMTVPDHTLQTPISIKIFPLPLPLSNPDYIN